MIHKGTLGRVENITKFYGKPIYHVRFFPVGKRDFVWKFDESELEPTISANPPQFDDNPHVDRYTAPRVGRPSHVNKDGGPSFRANYKDFNRGSVPSRVQKIPIEKFEAWLRKNGSKEEIDRYMKTKAAYETFHHGAAPRYVTRRVVDVGAGDKVVGRSFMYSAGKAPFTPYVTPKGSKKGGGGVPYLHEWAQPPQLLVTYKGKTLLHPLEGSAKATDWLHG